MNLMSWIGGLLKKSAPKTKRGTVKTIVTDT